MKHYLLIFFFCPFFTALNAQTNGDSCLRHVVLNWPSGEPGLSSHGDTLSVHWVSPAASIAYRIRFKLPGNTPLDTLSKTYNAGGKLFLNPRGGYFFASHSADSIVLTKLKDNFDTLWQTRYYLGKDSASAVLAIVETDDGRIWPALYKAPYAKILQLDADGSLRWKQNFLLNAEYLTRLHGFKDHIMMEYSLGANYLARVDSEGKMSWSYVFVGGQASSVRGIVQTAGGDYLFTRWTTGATGPSISCSIHRLSASGKPVAEKFMYSFLPDNLSHFINDIGGIVALDAGRYLTCYRRVRTDGTAEAVWLWINEDFNEWCARIFPASTNFVPLVWAPVPNTSWMAWAGPETPLTTGGGLLNLSCILPCATSSSEESSITDWVLSPRPNPVVDMLTLEFPRLFSGIIRVFDASGKIQVQMQATEVEKITLNTHSWSPGIYKLSCEEARRGRSQWHTLVKAKVE